MTLVSNLARLQSIDQERDEKRHRLEQIAKTLMNDPQLAGARTARDAAGNQVALLHTQMRDAELASKALDGKIKELEKNLASGQVTNPRELDALEKDRQMHLRQRGELDTRLLELLDAIELAQKQNKESDAALKKYETANASDVQKLGRERDALNARLAKLAAESQSVRDAIDPNTVSTYERLRQAKAGRALARLKNGSCSACGVQIPLGLVSRVEDGEDLIFCPDCGRILAA